MYAYSGGARGAGGGGGGGGVNATWFIVHAPPSFRRRAVYTHVFVFVQGLLVVLVRFVCRPPAGKNPGYVGRGRQRQLSREIRTFCLREGRVKLRRSSGRERAGVLTER